MKCGKTVRGLQKLDKKTPMKLMIQCLIRSGGEREYDGLIGNLFRRNLREGF